MRRIFIALIAGGLLLVSGVAASAKLDSASSQSGQHGQQQNHAQNDKKTAPKAAAKPVDEPETTPAPPALVENKPATAETKPATTATTPAVPTQAQCGFQGEQTGEHEDAACNDQKGQAGVNESKSEADDTADLPGKDDNQQGNNQD